VAPNKIAVTAGSNDAVHPVRRAPVVNLPIKPWVDFAVVLTFRSHTTKTIAKERSAMALVEFQTIIGVKTLEVGPQELAKQSRWRKQK